jgi:hypothetical protein
MIKRQKIVLFFSIYHLVVQGKAMTSFEGLKDLFIVLKVKHTLKKHWSDSIGWGIIQIMNDLLESI